MAFIQSEAHVTTTLCPGTLVTPVTTAAWSSSDGQQATGHLSLTTVRTLIHA